jgi:hypothetical protein
MTQIVILIASLLKMAIKKELIRTGSDVIILIRVISSWISDPKKLEEIIFKWVMFTTLSVVTAHSIQESVLTCLLSMLGVSADSRTHRLHYLSRDYTPRDTQQH